MFRGSNFSVYLKERVYKASQYAGIFSFSSKRPQTSLKSKFEPYFTSLVFASSFLGEVFGEGCVLVFVCIKILLQEHPLDSAPHYSPHHHYPCPNLCFEGHQKVTIIYKVIYTLPSKNVPTSKGKGNRRGRLKTLKECKRLILNIV